MTMTVRRLINALKKMPPRAKVCFVAHDQNPDDGEFDGAVSLVQEAPDAIKARGYEVVILP